MQTGSEVIDLTNDSDDGGPATPDNSPDNSPVGLREPTWVDLTVYRDEEEVEEKIASAGEGAIKNISSV